MLLLSSKCSQDLTTSQSCQWYPGPSQLHPLPRLKQSPAYCFPCLHWPSSLFCPLDTGYEISICWPLAFTLGIVFLWCFNGSSSSIHFHCPCNNYMHPLKSWYIAPISASSSSTYHPSSPPLTVLTFALPQLARGYAYLTYNQQWGSRCQSADR